MVTEQGPMTNESVNEAKARQYRERAAEIRATAENERPLYRRQQRLAYADTLDRLAARLEAEAGAAPHDPAATPPLSRRRE